MNSYKSRTYYHCLVMPVQRIIFFTDRIMPEFIGILIIVYIIMSGSGTNIQIQSMCIILNVQEYLKLNWTFNLNYLNISRSIWTKDVQSLALCFL